MKRFLGIVVLSIVVVSMGSFYAFAEGSSGDRGVDQLESLGGDEYISDSGEIVQMEDIGGGDEMSDSGEIYQSSGFGDGELVTSTGELIQVDE